MNPRHRATLERVSVMAQHLAENYTATDRAYRDPEAARRTYRAMLDELVVTVAGLRDDIQSTDPEDS